MSLNTSSLTVLSFAFGLKRFLKSFIMLSSAMSLSVWVISLVLLYLWKHFYYYWICACYLHQFDYNVMRKYIVVFNKAYLCMLQLRWKWICQYFSYFGL